MRHCVDIIVFVRLGDAFQSLQSSFLEKHYEQFEETEENKFIYSDIHKEYVSKILQYCWYDWEYCNFSLLSFAVIKSFLILFEMEANSVFQYRYLAI